MSRINHVSEHSAVGYPVDMAVNWLELAQKMAQAARAGVAIGRKRLQEILAERHPLPPSTRDLRRTLSPLHCNCRTRL
jgi:hypothetical protein